MHLQNFRELDEIILYKVHQLISVKVIKQVIRISEKFLNTNNIKCDQRKHKFLILLILH